MHENKFHFLYVEPATQELPSNLKIWSSYEILTSPPVFMLFYEFNFYIIKDLELLFFLWNHSLNFSTILPLKPNSLENGDFQPFSWKWWLSTFYSILESKSVFPLLLVTLLWCRLRYKWLEEDPPWRWPISEHFWSSLVRYVKYESTFSQIMIMKALELLFWHHKHDKGWFTTKPLFLLKRQQICE